MSANAVTTVSIPIGPSPASQQPAPLNALSAVSKPTSKNLFNAHNNNKEKFFSLLLRHNSSRKVCAFILFAILSMIVGIRTVCPTASKGTNTTCEMKFTRMVQSETTYNSRPRHVAVGDFNQDSYLDLVIADTDIDNIGIRFGHNNGTFADQCLYLTGNESQPYWIVVEDFNNDDRLDIAVANYGNNNIGIFLGDGNGSFTTYKTFSLGASRPLALAIGHFNNDSEWDIAVVNNGTFDVAILYGAGDGSFEMGPLFFMEFDAMPCSIAVADVNKDNRSDIVVVNYGTSELVILLPSENGTFMVEKYSTGMNSHPTSVTIDYFDSDDYLDIAVANSATYNIGVFIGDVNGKFKLMQTYPTSSNSYLQFIVAGQFNNDSTRDLAVVDSNENYVIIFEGNGNGSFSIVANQSTGYGSGPYSIAIANFNNDNQSDIIIVNNDNNNILLFSLYTFQTTATQKSYSTGPDSFPNFVTVADVNNDQYLDVTVVNLYSSNIGVFIGLGDGSFKSQKIVPMRMDELYPYSFATGDFNKDKQLDIAVVIPAYDEIDIYFGKGDGNFQFGRFISIEHRSLPISIIIDDFNNDNNPDMATANYGANNLAVFLGSSNGTFLTATYYNLTKYDAAPIFIAAGHFNNDSFFDLICANDESPSITILLGNGDGTFQTAVSINFDDFYPSSIVIGDLNNNAQDDIVLTSTSNSVAVVLIGNGDGTFQDPYIYMADSGATLWSAALGNFNKNGILGIAVADATDYSVVIFLRNGNQSLTERNTIFLENAYVPSRIAAGDFNNDTETDLVVVNSDSDIITVLFLKYQAAFANQTSYSQESGKHPYSIITGDFDNDHRLDIAVANSGRDNVEILTDYDNGTFRKSIIYPTGDNSYPRYLVTGDFEKNHHLDIAVVNTRKDSLMIILNPGNETMTRSFLYSTGAGSFPNALATGDINKDGWTDIVVTNGNTDSMVVFLGFNYSTFTIDQTIQFNRGSTPDSVAVGDFNGDSLWDLAIACQEMGTIYILLGNSDGTFRNQSSNSLGGSLDTITFVIDDFNNDNQPDLAVAASYNQSIYILLGNGDGTFSKYIRQSTDSLVPVFIASGDFDNDGKRDLVVVNGFGHNIGLFFGYGNGSLLEPILHSMPNQSTPVWIALGDFNNDNISDLAVANRRGDSIGIFLGIRDGTFENLTIYPTGNHSAPYSLSIGDFDKDNCIDIAVVNGGAKTLGIFFGYGNGTFSSQVTYTIKLNSILKTIIVEDLNNDTILDIAITDFSDGNGNIEIFYGLGERRFLVPKIYSTGYKTQVSSMAIQDFNNDGRIDFVVIISKKNRVAIMLQDTSEPFGSSVTFYTDIGSNPSAIAVYDLNNDNQLDIAIVNSKTSNIQILLGDGNGKFLNWRTYFTGLNTFPNSIFIGDVDGDQQHDILVTNPNTDTIGIFFGYGNGTFALVQTYSTGHGSDPCSLSIADLDKDNLMDIIFANTGINTVVIFYGTGNRTFLHSELYPFEYDSRPRAIAIDDLNNDTWLDIAVANYGSGSVDVLFYTC